jgi:hypothetical protein
LSVSQRDRRDPSCLSKPRTTPLAAQSSRRPVGHPSPRCRSRAVREVSSTRRHSGDRCHLDGELGCALLGHVSALVHGVDGSRRVVGAVGGNELGVLERGVDAADSRGLRADPAAEQSPPARVAEHGPHDRPKPGNATLVDHLEPCLGEQAAHVVGWACSNGAST